MLPKRTFGSKLATFVLTVLLTAIVVGAISGANLYVSSRAKSNFDFRVQETRTQLLNRLEDYGRLTSALEAYLELDENISLKEFSKYEDWISVTTQYPGVSSIGMAVLATPEEQDALFTEITLDIEDLNSGKAFQLPLAKATDSNQYVLKYVAPTSPELLSALGFNLSGETKRAKAISQAIETSEAVISDQIQLATSTTGFILVKKLEEKQDSLLVLAFRSQDFYRELLTDLVNEEEIHVELYDARTNKLLFREVSESSDDLNQEILISFNNLDLKLNLLAPSTYNLPSEITLLPFFIGLGASAISIAIMIVFLRLNRYRSETEKIAKDNATKAAKLEDQLQTILDNTSIVVTIKDLNGKYLLANREFTRKMNVESQTIVGKSDFDIFPAKLAAQVVENDRKVVYKKETLEFEEHFTDQQNNQLVYYAQKFPLLNDKQEVYAVGTISTDITSQKKDTERLKERKSELERINSIMIDREIKMIELKNDIKSLRKKLQEAGIEVEELETEIPLVKKEKDGKSE